MNDVVHVALLVAVVLMSFYAGWVARGDAAAIMRDYRSRLDALEKDE